MSLHYEVVFSCFLRDDTPAEVLDLLRWHIGATEERPAGAGPDDTPLLGPDPWSRLPGGDVASLVPGYRHAWGLFTRNSWLDDDMGELTTVLDLIAPYAAEDGYIGHFREELDVETAVLTLNDGEVGLAKSPAG